MQSYKQVSSHGMWIWSVLPGTATLFLFVCFTLSFDEAPIFLLKRKKKVVLLNNPPLNYSKSLEEYGVGWFGGCVGMCQTISPLSCYASLHTKFRLLGHLCLCSVARPPCTDASFTQSYLPRTFKTPLMSSQPFTHPGIPKPQPLLPAASYLLPHTSEMHGPLHKPFLLPISQKTPLPPPQHWDRSAYTSVSCQP